MHPHRRLLSATCHAAPCPAAAPAVSVAVAAAAHRHRHVTNVIIISAAIVAAALLLSATYYAVLRRRRGGAARSLRRPLSWSGPGADEPSVHHAWLIRTVGLDDATIDAIGVAEYRDGAGDEGFSDCAVCLAEFEDGELVRLLPKCGHAFHVACIDTWLRARVNCPLCRALIVDPPLDSAVDGGESAELGPDSEIPQSETLDLDGDRNREGLEDGIEIRVSIGAGEEFESPPESSSPTGFDSTSLSTPSTSVVRVLEGGGSGSGEEEKDCNFEEGNGGRSRSKAGNSSKGDLEEKTHSEIGRSSSNSARGFFFSRH